MKARHYILLLTVLVLTGSCSELRRLQKSESVQEKYEGAVRFYEEEDYYRAGILFEEILPFLRGSEQAENANFYFAYTQYHQRQYIMSSHYFKKFYDTYRRSDYAQEAFYMFAYSLYNQSPVYNLDQTSTEEAIAAMQTYLNKYPYSEFKEDANKIIDELQAKLEKKAYENSKLYYNLEYLKSAIITMENFEKDFPDSDYKEEVTYLKIKSAYRYAEKSVLSKQVERYQQCVDFYTEFADEYEESGYYKELGGFYEKSLDRIKELKSLTNQ